MVTAILAIAQFQRTISLGERELDWKQAEQGRILVDRMLADEGWQAMLMLDWDEGQDFEMPSGKKERIVPAEVFVALREAISDQPVQRTEKQLTIANRFDRLFFLVSQLQIAVRSGLVKRADVQFPLSWYAGKQLCLEKALLVKYMATNSAKETQDFFNDLDSWRNCLPKKPSPPESPGTAR